MVNSQAIEQILLDALEAKSFPSVVAIIGNAKETLWRFVGGVNEYGGENVTQQTYYDLASLTKVVSTLPAILKLVSEGALKLDDTVGKFIHNAGWFQTPSLADVTIKQLLTHSSGLPAWKPLFAWVSERQTAVANVLQSQLEHPTGTFVYSDLGFIALGAITERITKMRQDVFVKEQIFDPLDMKHTRYGPIEKLPTASTEDCPWRNQVLRGVVHDENAFCLSQVAGHAGLFGTAEDIATYARAWLSLDSRLGKERVLQAAIEEQLSQDGVRRGLGWALKGENAFGGSRATLKGFGHTGFTGTSLWIEPEENWFAVLLTNRVHPSRQCGANIHQIRKTFHDAVSKELA